MGSKLGLKTKLLLLCAFMSVIPVVVGVVSFFGLHKVGTSYEKVTSGVLPNVESVDSMYLHFKGVRIALRSLGLEGLKKEEGEEYLALVQESMDAYEKANQTYIGTKFLPGEKELYDEVEKTWSSFKKVGAEAIGYYKSGKPEDREKMLHIFLVECPEYAKTYTGAIEKLSAFHNKNGDDWVRDAQVTAAETDKVTLLTIVIGVISGMGIGFYFATTLSKRIGNVSMDLAEGSNQVSQAAEQIANSSQSLSQASSQQAASLEETVATMEELTSMVKTNSENAKQAASLALSTRDIAVKGETEIKTLIESIRTISSDSKKIAEITSVIDDIAFQTNLLALNASVEAARAGEQGKGFAVVAEAVRSLAQRSAEAAKNIANLISESVERINQGSQQANQGGQVLAEIVTSVKKVADLNSEIASASEEQSKGIEQIGKAMNHLDEVTQQNAAASEEAAAAAEELSAQSGSLMGSVSALNQVVTGKEQVVAEEPKQVLQFKPKKSAPSKPAVKAKPAPRGATRADSGNVIPFDEDLAIGKVGTTDGF